MATQGSITVSIEGLEDLRGKLHGERADKPVNRFLDRGAAIIQRGGRKKAPKDTGRLRNSIGIESSGHRERSVGPSVDYGEHVEFGTRPHYPPLDALWGWAKRHGGIDPFALQQSIGMWGTEAQPYMGPAAEEAEPAIAALVPILASEIESAFQ